MPMKQIFNEVWPCQQLKFPYNDIVIVESAIIILRPILATGIYLPNFPAAALLAWIFWHLSR